MALATSTIDRVSYARLGAIIRVRVTRDLNYYIPAAQHSLPAGIIWNAYELSGEQTMHNAYYVSADDEYACVMCLKRGPTTYTYVDSLSVLTICASCSSYAGCLVRDHECVATIVTAERASFLITSNFYMFALRVLACDSSTFCQGCKVTRVDGGACQHCVRYIDSRILSRWLVRLACVSRGLVDDVAVMICDWVLLLFDCIATTHIDR